MNGQLTRTYLMIMLLAVGLSATTGRWAFAQDVAVAEAVDETEAPKAEAEEEVDELAPLRKEQERLAAEAALSQAKLEAELRKMREETTVLQTKLALAQARHEAKMAEINQTQALADAEMAAKNRALQQELAEARQKVERLTAAQSLRDAEQAKALADAKAEVAAIESEMSLDNARQRKALADLKLENEKLQAEISLKQTQMSKQELEFNVSMAAHEREMKTLQADIAKRDLRYKWASGVNNKIEYAAEPYADGVLRISDRRIDLNGPIAYGTDDYVCDRIHFYNNQSKTEPIFIVIDRSPGGSVMVGYRILKAMEASEAPIHVVVKSFAASMAAAITTLADESYAYPNAIILHHQMSAGMSGNMTQMGERYEKMKEWAKRLHNPIAEKMGVSPDRFTEMMYEANSDGDWDEFATEAVKLKWVDHIVKEVREEGIIDKPEQQYGFFFFFQKELEKHEKTDGETGQRYLELPRLQPMDYYYLYNPDNYYRMR